MKKSICAISLVLAVSLASYVGATDYRVANVTEFISVYPMTLDNDSITTTAPGAYSNPGQVGEAACLVIGKNIGLFNEALKEKTYLYIRVDSASVHTENFTIGRVDFSYAEGEETFTSLKGNTLGSIADYGGCFSATFGKNSVAGLLFEETDFSDCNARISGGLYSLETKSGATANVDFLWNTATTAYTGGEIRNGRIVVAPESSLEVNWINDLVRGGDSAGNHQDGTHVYNDGSFIGYMEKSTWTDFGENGYGLRLTAGPNATISKFTFYDSVVESGVIVEGNWDITIIDDPCKNFTPETTYCGIGACESPGLLTCTDVDRDGIHEYHDSCVPGTPSDEIDDGIDNDCDIVVDEDFDADGDGFTPVFGRDCDDTDSHIFPGAEEVCDGADNNCDWQTDEGVLNACGGCGVVPAEIDDGVDNDCDSLIDEGFDTDGDGLTPIFGGDCNDSNSAVHPGAMEVCGNGLDDDCSGGDEVCPSVWYQDLDGDSHSNGQTLVRIERPLGFYLAEDLLALTGDCDDADRSVHPGAIDTCYDGVDQDCSGTADEGCENNQFFTLEIEGTEVLFTYSGPRDARFSDHVTKGEFLEYIFEEFSFTANIDAGVNVTLELPFQIPEGYGIWRVEVNGLTELESSVRAGRTIIDFTLLSESELIALLVDNRHQGALINVRFYLGMPIPAPEPEPEPKTSGEGGGGGGCFLQTL